MCAANFGFVFVILIVLNVVICQPPQWQTPTDQSSYTLDLTSSTACGTEQNVLSDILYAKSSTGDPVHYRIVSQSPSDDAFKKTLTISSDEIIACTKANVKSDSYTLVLGAYYDPRTSTNENTITVTINVQSATPNKPPVFVKPNPDVNANDHEIKLEETVPSVILELQATDDATSADSLTFIMPDTNDATTKALFKVDGKQLKVNDKVTKETFDADKEGVTLTYPIILEVSDGSLSTKLSTNIVLVDLNDEKPVFDGDATVNLDSRAKEGDTVLVLKATDADKDSKNNQVSFEVPGQLPPVFQLSGDKVLVAAGATFNPTDTPRYSFTITAKDNGNTPLTSDKLFTVEIKSAPVFIDPDPDSTKDEHIINMCETLQSGADIMTLQATDPDSDDDALKYELDKSNSDKVKGLFTIVKNILKVASSVATDYFDYDKKDAKRSYDIILKVTDELGISTTLSTKINIEDDNDNKPVFSGDTKVSLPESSPKGTTVLKVTATDNDVSAEFNQVSFTLSGDDAAPFVLGGEGKDEILVGDGVTFSFKTKSSYKLTVTASDNDKDSPSTATQEVTITIATAPTFTKPTNDGTLTVEENSPVDKIIETLEAKDEDGDKPMFTLVSQEPNSDKFVLDGDKLKTKGTFDIDVANAVTTYTLTLKVSDGNEKTADESIKVKINIQDSNTKSPVFKADGVYEAKVKETEKIGYKVLTVIAIDGDHTETNNKVTYSLPVGTTDFAIDGSSGAITVAKGLSYASKKLYELAVTAKDGGDKSATQTVKFTILAEPIFVNLKEPKSIPIEENKPSGTSLFTVTVMDSDNTWDKKIEIASSLPENIFKMEGDILKTNTDDLDAEKASKYELTLKVTDGDFIVTSGKLTITVSDLNDEKPVITKVSDVKIPENTAINAVVVESIEVKDGDISKPNNEFSYAITSGNDDNTFKIDATSGKIQLNSQLSKETYTLQVTVSDKGDPIQSATTDIKIIVDPNTVDECSGTPCKNGATCVSSVNQYKCQCVSGFIGKDCETNRNECDPDPCLNGGLCIDGINMYTCDCEKGWGGKTCSDACTNNKYGKNCERDCKCNTTRLIANVEAQQCDIKEGACKCNTNYVGATCEDKNECTDQNICKNEPNVVCENTIGGYSCVCEQFYRKDSNSNVCTRHSDDTTVNVDKANEKAVNCDRALDTDCPPGLNKPSVYNMTKDKIEKAEKAALPAAKNVKAVNISCGSLEYGLIIVTDKEKVQQLSKELASTSDTLMYDGKSVPVSKLSVNNADVKAQTSSAEQICTTYKSLEQCSSDKCVIENGLPICQSLEEDDNDNLKLILGLGLGVCLPLLLLALIAAACFYKTFKRAKYEERRREYGYKRESRRKESSPWYGQMKKNGFRMDTRNYNGYGYDDNKYIENFYNRKSVNDMPGLSYTTI